VVHCILEDKNQNRSVNSDSYLGGTAAFNIDTFPKELKNGGVPGRKEKIKHD